MPVTKVEAIQYINRLETALKSGELTRPGALVKQIQELKARWGLVPTKNLYVSEVWLVQAHKPLPKKV
jgi:hypothetical protein